MRRDPPANAGAANVKRYLARRIGGAVVLLWVVASVVFFSLYLLPGDPALIILGGLDAHPSPEQVQRVRAQLGLDRPVVVQYLGWASGLLRGDLGRSLVSGRAVTTDLAVRLLRTLQLIVPAAGVAMAIGIPAGVYSARARDTLMDPIVSALTLLGFSVPVFVIGPGLVSIFTLWLGLLPSGGYVGAFQDPGGFAVHLILPALALAAAPAATTMRMTRSSILEQTSLDYVRTARSKGLGERQVVGRHVLRNALLPVLTVLGLQVGAMFAGSVLVETIFNWPGMNLFLLEALGQRDYPVIQAVVLVAASIFIAVNVLIDVTYALVDPRIRYA
ncbi:MAG TPA: ABC transporter permease [bacterium]|nr:ABC transporter permease [bacterium]